MAATSLRSKSPSITDEVRPIWETPSGRLSHYSLPAGAVWAVENRTVDELWHVREGRGHLRRPGRGVVELRPGTSVLIPAQTGFQLRTDLGESLELLVMSIPTTVPPASGAAPREQQKP